MVAQYDEGKWTGPIDSKDATGLSEVNHQARVEFLPVEYATRSVYFPWINNILLDIVSNWLHSYGQERVPWSKRFAFGSNYGLVKVALRGCSIGWPYTHDHTQVAWLKDEQGRTHAMVSSRSAEHTATVGAIVCADIMLREDGSVYLSANTAEKIIGALK